MAGAGADKFRYEGQDYYLHPQGCMAFITMNPGYLGRAELPESLKVLFRPVTVMVPDMNMIMENMLMAEGYQTAKGLAKKFFTLCAARTRTSRHNPTRPDSSTPLPGRGAWRRARAPCLP